MERTTSTHAADLALAAVGKDGVAEMQTYGMRARTNCEYGAEACSPCVKGLISTFRADEGGLDIARQDARVRFVGYEVGESVIRHHIQGIARLADLVHKDGRRTGRIVLTDNLSPRGLSYAERTFMTEEDTLFSGGTYTIVRALDLRRDFKHPGGAQAHGNTMVVAMAGEHTRTGAYFVRFPPHGRPKVIHRLFIDGARGEPRLSRRNRWDSSSAAFIQLRSGRFLLAVAGGNHGADGIWFYASLDSEIGRSTEWKFLGAWSTCQDASDGLDISRCFAGASGMALLADCSGEIYLVAMHGTSQSRDEYQWVQVFSVHERANQRIGLRLRSWQRDYTGKLQRNNPAFRWAGTASVTSKPKALALLNSVRDPTTNACRAVCSNVYWSKH